jgi:hypothetical protein
MGTKNSPILRRYEEMAEWLGGEFDPERFDSKEVKFDDPARRLRTAFDL